MKSAALAALLLAAIAPAQTGEFALLRGTPQVVSKFWTTHGTGQSYTLHVQQFAKDGATIEAYDIDMQHFMHLVVVRDDFATFAHEHPSFNAATGIFDAPFVKQRNHRYHVYADSMPTGIGQQVFRFLMESDGPYAMYKLSAAASGPNSKAGPYTVTLAKTTIAAGTPQSLDLTVESDDDPATDLVPYLGAPAHVVMIDMSTLAYIHAHPLLRGQTMHMNGSTDTMNVSAANKAGAFMKLELPALPRGTYKTWVQISGGKEHTVYTAPFTLVAR